ncbi:MAG TPA: hypothetical protein VE981_08240, partial [Planctomycetota bacterium]|nr:hypothetical protein [Planctomycetota bacterium]
EQAVSKPPPPPVAIAELPESVQLRKCMELEKENKEVLAAWPDVLSAYDVFINSTASASFILKGKTARQEFVDFMEKRAELEFDRRRKETDPYRRVRSLQSYPRILIDLTSIDKRLREELAFAHGEAETKYLNDERQIDAALKENRFKEALTLLDALIPVSEGARQERLLKIKDDTQRREKDFEDETLRRVTQGYSAVHAAFEEALTKRETGTAYSKVTKFIRDQTGESERMKIRVPGLGYEPLLKPFPDKLLTDDQMLARSTISGAMNRARDTLGYRILSDLLDALDVEFLIRQATRGLDGIARVNGEIHLATFNATGKVTLDVALYKFAQKTGTPKTIDYRQLHVQDILQLAALPLELPVEQIFESNEEMCRTMGEMWVYSGLPQRWAQAGRCLQQAKKLGALGLDFRLEDFRERGYQEVRNRIASSRKEFERKNFDGAKQLLAEIEEAWKHDPSLKAEIGRAMATVLVAEVLQHDRNRDWTRLKAAARLLRTKYPKMYPEEVIFAPYANALRQTGEWRSTANLLNDDWTWEGRAQGTPCPAEDETTAGRGLKLKSEKPMRVAPVRSRGSTGAQVELTIAPPQSAFSTGFRFDVSDADGLYKKLVIRDTGEVTLYAFDGREEKRVDRGSLGKKLSVNQWVELAFAAEGGDLVCFVDQRPVLLTAVPVGVDRDIEIWSTATANFRLLKLRK